ncbi:MAG: extracellular solute-binding protein [Lachnospiraceae bacterium]|nr:extracellular solute-binding protein [Lachnospiraceae bacterium]
MKKRIVAVLLTSLMAVSAVACGSKTAEPEADASGAASKTDATETKDVTLTVWGPQEDQVNADGDEGSTGWLQEQCEAFNEAHPEWNITFNYGVCSEGDAATNVPADVDAAGDVYFFANDQIPQLVDAGALAELGGSALETVKSINSEAVVNSVTEDGSVYGVPFTGNTWFMYYDTRVFSADDVKSLDTMLEKGKVAFPLSNAWYLGAMYAANGCTFFGADGQDEKAGIDFDGDKATAVTNYLVDLAANPNFMDDADGAGIAGLGDGTVAAIFSGTWDYNNVVEALGKENVGVVAAPTIKIDGQDKQMLPFAGSKAIGVNPKAKDQQVAVALALYLGSEDAQKAHYEERNIIPTANSIDLSSDLMAAAQADTMDNKSILQPVFPEMGWYWTPAADFAKAIISGDVNHDNAADQTATFNTQLNTEPVSE